MIVDKEGIVPSPPGIWINGENYFLIDWRPDINTAYLKNMTGGATICKTTKLILLAIWKKDKKQNPSNCNEAMENFQAKYLGINY